MPHAEMPLEERDRMLAKFLAAYNAHHGTNYTLAEEEPASDPSCDYLCRDPSRPDEPLKIQHTDAWTEPESERVRPRFLEEQIVRRIEAELRARGIRGFHISLVIDARPTGKKAANELFDNIMEALEHATRPGALVPPGQITLRFDRDDIRDFYERIRPYVASLEVLRLPDGAGLSIGYSPTNMAEGVLDPATRVLNALDPKDTRLGRSAADLVLLIRCTSLPFDQSIDLPEFRRQLQERKSHFREVWIVNDFEESAPPFAVRILP